MIDFIIGEKFIALAGGKIYYQHTHEVNTFFKNPPKEEFILISHNSDGCVMDNPTRWDHADSTRMPDNLIHWYAQNVNVVNHRIESIPIGLENGKWFPKLQKKLMMLNKLKEKKEFRNLLYVDFNRVTNPVKRDTPYKLFKDKCWTTCREGRNGIRFRGYLDNIYNHPFVACPEGNGIDTVRVWESLYMGSIPVQIRSINNMFYTDLPICFVDDWEEVTEDLLVKESKRILWNMDMLKFSFWKDKINGN